MLRLRCNFISVLCCCLTWLSAQTLDSTDVATPLNTVIVLDSLPTLDSLSQLDSLGSDSLNSNLGYIISKDGIDQQIDYGSKDSLIMDNVNRLVHLYGDAYVQYGTLELKANYILLDLNTNIALAEGTPDSLGKIAGKPVFKDGAQEFEAGRMRYNFKTKKGLVYEVTTTEGDLYILGATTKFFGEGGEDDRINNTVYSSDAIFTTCDHDVPHFGIRSKKQKVIPNKVAIVGPSNLEIGGVPTPLYLPFGFFPLKTGKRGGLMFPNNYQYSERWGFGLENVGYFLPISDNFDLTLMTDFYFRGSYGIDSDLRYKKRYKYQGSLKLGYSSYKTEEIQSLSSGSGSELTNVRQNSYFIRLSHSQNPNAHPYRSLSGSINMEVNRYENLNYNDANRVLNNNLNSNFTLTQQFPGSPFTATLGLAHSQNTSTRQMRMSLPRFDLKMKQINPFKKKRRTGPEKWYEKVSLSYSTALKYDLSGIDSVFFEQETFQNGKFGVQHNVTTNVNFNLFKYFTVTPFVNFKETWYTKETNKSFFDSLSIQIDTIYDNPDSSDFVLRRDTLSLGRDLDVRNSNFNAIHQYDAGVSLFTKIYGTVRFKKGWLRGLRHTAKPTITMSYSPNYRRESLGYYDEYVSKSSTGELDTISYSIFEDENFGSPSGSERFALNYSLTNLFEAKLFSKKDSTTKKAKILDNLNFSGNYNFIADSLNWSPISFSGNIRLLKGLATIKLSGAYDPYTLDEDGRRINTFEKDVSGKLLRFDNARISLNTGMTVKQLRGLFAQKDKAGLKKKGAEVATLGNFFDALRLTYQFTMTTRMRSDNSIHLQPSVHSVVLRGDIPLSPKWRLTVGNIDYNFIRKSVSYPDLSLSRDLHCWTMGVSWQPERSTYNFYLRVKPGSLDFVKLPYRRNRADGFDN